MQPGARAVEARRLSYGGSLEAAHEIAVPVEAPVNIVYGGIPHVVLMATPDRLDDLAAGFSLTEGIAVHPGDLRAMEIETMPEGISVRIDLAPEAMKRFLARRRNMAGRTSCGLCGLEDLAQLRLARPGRGKANTPVAPAAIARALAALPCLQPLNEATRGVHGAAWFARDGTPVLAREDVGRHNALDKMIGACLAGKIAAQAGFAVITSRCSFEMIEKAALFGADTLVAISAPTSLAIERALALGITLIGVARADGAMVFTEAAGDHAARIVQEQEA